MPRPPHPTRAGVSIESSPNGAHPMRTVIETLDLIPTWESLLPIYCAVLREGTSKGHDHCLMELLRMAQAADKWNVHVKSLNLPEGER